MSRFISNEVILNRQPNIEENAILACVRLSQTCTTTFPRTHIEHINFTFVNFYLLFFFFFSSSSSSFLLFPCPPSPTPLSIDGRQNRRRISKFPSIDAYLKKSFLACIKTHYHSASWADLSFCIVIG